MYQTAPLPLLLGLLVFAPAAGGRTLAGVDLPDTVVVDGATLLADCFGGVRSVQRRQHEEGAVPAPYVLGDPHGRNRSRVVEPAGFRHDHAPAASEEGPHRSGRFDLLDRLSAVVAERGHERRAAQRADAAAGWHARRGRARDALRRLLAVDARIDELEHPELHREDRRD